MSRSVNVRVARRVLSMSLIPLCSLFAASTANAQDLRWTNSFRGAGTDLVTSVAHNGSGDVFIGGRFQADIGFSPPLNSAGLSDGFVARMGSGGNVVWVSQIASVDNVSVADVAADGAGNCYATGFVVSSADFDGTVVGGDGAGDVFVARYSPSGTVQLVRTFGGPDFDVGNAKHAADGYG